MFGTSSFWKGVHVNCCLERNRFALGVVGRSNPSRRKIFAWIATLFFLWPSVLLAVTNVTYVQSNYSVPQSSPSSVSVPFTSTQTAGDLNIVVVGWNDTAAKVSAVSDTDGNVYALAAGPTTVTGTLSQSIYVAKNIVAGTNTVKVVFSTGALSPDIRVLEYAGTDLSNPVDVAAAGTGSGGTSSSGSATTTNASDLIFGANIVTGITSGPGSGFTRRILTSPDGDIAEDRSVTAAGSYSATAPATGKWIMQMVALRTVTGATGVAPSITSASNTTFTQGASGSFTVTATGTPTPSLTESGSLPNGVTFHDNGNGTATLSGTAAVLGSYPITFTASNGIGTPATQSFTLTVNQPNQAPAITSVASTTFGAGTSGAFTVAATGAPTPSLTESGTLPNGVTFHDNGNGTASLAGTPTSGGTYPLTITASNGVGTAASQNFVLTVTQAAAITSSASVTFTAGTAGTFTVTTIGTPAPSLAETGSLPNGVTFTDKGNGTARIAGTPGSGTQGTYSLTITASNGIGTAATQNFSLVVNPSNQSAPIAFVQENYSTPQGSQTTLRVTYTKAQSAGDLNVVVVGWNDSTRKVSSVVDSQGNSYVVAVGPTVQTGDATEVIYYAQNIVAAAANSNTVTVTFNGGAVSPDIRIAEYSGIATGNALDVTAAVQGTSGTSNSGSATTTNSNDLLLGANLVQQTTNGAGAGYTVRVITSPDSDILEDSIVSSTGSYSATASLSGGAWIMQMAAFRGGGGGGVSGTSPSITSANTTTFSAGTSGNFTVTTTGTPTPSLTETGALPAGVNFHDNGNGTATLSGTASAAGSYPIAITANNGIGAAATQNFSLLVEQAPAITSANSATFTAGTAGSFTVSATGVPTPALAEAGALPSGVTLVDNGNGTATLGGTAASGTAGSFAITISATNGVGSPATQNFTLTVSSTDTQPPTTPTNLTATAVSGSQINLSWTASTDNVGVTGYLVERCAGVGCTNFARTLTVPGTTYSDTGLTPNTSYTYQVKATDAAGNFSPYSNTATATTLQTIAGLVAAYSFDEGTGNTVNDLSGNGNNGTLSNATWTNAGKFGNALVFNGSSSLVTIADSASLHLSTGMTLEAWVNPSQVNSKWTDVIYKGNDNYFLEGTSSKGSPAGGGTFGSNDVANFGTAALPTNTWTQLAFSYDGATLRLYVNGVQVSSLAETGNIATSTNPLQIGGDSVFGQYFAGTIDEVRVYNIPLNQTQIQSDMGTPVSTLSSLPVVSVDGSTNVSFGNEATGTTSGAQTVTLTNSGSSQLSINGIAISGGDTGDFAQTNTCGSALAAGNSCTISMTFTPQATGSRTSSVQITDNAPGSPQVINLSGTGTGFSVAPQSAVLTYTATQQFSANSGNVTWSVDGVAGGSASSGTITANGLYSPPTNSGTHLIAAATSSGSASATVYVTNYPGTFTFHNDNSRSGLNSGETVLNLSDVNQAQFGKLFSYGLDGLAYASPLYVANVNIPNQGFHNVVYIATENDTVYAWDADGLTTSPLWKDSFLGSGVTTIPCGDTGECGDIPTQIGITGTPVIDSSTGTMYVVASTKEGGNYVQRLHALDITTGAEKFGGPVVIQATVSGTGNGSQGNQLAFDPLRENQRAALLLSNGIVYVAWAAHGDQEPWHGWVMGYRASNLQQTMTYCVSPNGYGGGIWMSNGGLATDSTGDLFFTTGNGDFSANSDGSDYGDSILKISTTGSVVDYFTPYDQSYMESNDIDLASAGPVLLVDQQGSIPHLLIAAGKSGSIYVVNRDNMGQFNPNNNSQIVQTLQSILPNGNQEEGNYSAPVFFNGYVYFGAVSDNLKAFQLTNGQLSPAPSSQSSEIYPNRGGSFAISTNGTSNGILWAVQDNSPSNGVLNAYNASDLSNEIYTSNQAGSRDTLGVATKFSIPTVANGKVFVVANGQIVVYGLLP
jgi:hypothetical protein